MKPALVARTAGSAVLIHPREESSPPCQAFAEGLAPDRQRTVVVLGLRSGPRPAELESIARLLRRRRGSFRLVPGWPSPDDAGSAAQWLADRLDREVVAPDGARITAAGGALFIPAGQGTGWLRYQRGRSALWDSRRFPKPYWEYATPDAPVPTGSGGVAEPVPGGVWLRPADDSGLTWQRDRLVDTVVAHPEHLAVVLGAPDAAPVPLADVAAFWNRLMPSIRLRVRFVPFGPVEGADRGALGQALADALGHQAVLYNGFPAVGRAGSTPEVYTVRGDGPLGWRPFAGELGYAPRTADGGRAHPPTLLNPRAPVPGLAEIGPGVYEYAPDVVLEVVQSGLWLRPSREPDNAAAVRTAPADPGHTAILCDESTPDAATRMLRYAHELLDRLDPAVRRHTLVLPAGSAAPVRRNAVATSPAAAAVALSPAAGRRAVAAAPAGKAVSAVAPAAPQHVRAPRAAPQLPLAAAPTTSGSGPQHGSPPPQPRPQRAAGPPPRSAPRAESRPQAPTAELQPGPVPPACPRPEAPPAPPSEAPPKPPSALPAAARAGLPSVPASVSPSDSGAPAPPVPRTASLPLPVPPPMAAAGGPPAATGPRPHTEPAAQTAQAPAPTDAPAPTPTGARPATRQADAGREAPSAASGAAVPARQAHALHGGGVLAQPAPEPAACVIPPDGGVDRERASLRDSVGRAYETAAGVVTRVMSESPGLRAAGSAAAKSALDELVAVRLYLTDACEPFDGAVRQGVAGGHVPFARCVAAGLRRLPAYRGAVMLRAALSDAERDWYRAGRVLTEWGFCAALTTARPGLPGNTDVLIWSRTSRPTSLIEPGVPDRVLFLPGTRFKVLGRDDGDRPGVLLRELAPAEAAEDGEPAAAARTALDDSALSGLEGVRRAIREARGVRPLPDSSVRKFGAPPGLIVSDRR